MQSNKPARKHHRKVQKAPEKLILKQPFEFVSQLPMQECLDRLKYISKESAYIAVVAPNKVELHWRQKGKYYGGKAWAKGYIEETESNTYIRGATGISIPDYFAFWVIFVILPLIIGMGQPKLLTVMIVIALGGLVMSLFTLRESDKHTRSMLLWDMQGIFEAKRIQPQHIVIPHQNIYNLGSDPPKKLWLRKKFAFVIQLPLQECAFHLDSVANHKIALSRLSEKQTQFTTYESQSRSADVWAFGRLEATTDSSTSVRGITGIGRSALIQFLFLPGLGLFVISVLREYPLNLAIVMSVGLSILTFIIQMVMIFFTRDSLVQRLRAVKTAEKSK